MSSIAPEGYKVIISTSKKLLDDNTQNLYKNGFIEEKVDNLKNVFKRKHKIKEERKRIYILQPLWFLIERNLGRIITF